MEDFELVTHLHNIGISDGKIGKPCNVSRQFICDVRNGKKKASPELRAKLQELYDAANRRGLFDIYIPSAQTPIVESTPIVASVAYYDPSAQYIPSSQQRGPINMPKQIQSPIPEQLVQSQPTKSQSPLSRFLEEEHLEKQARIAAQYQGNIGRKPTTAPRLLPFRVRWRQWVEHGNAYEHAKRYGLPLPVPPSNYYLEEPTMPEIQPRTGIRSPRAPEPKMRETQYTIESSPELSPFAIGYLADSEYRNNF